MKALTIALNDIRISLKEPALWLNVLVIPALLIVVIALANGQQIGATPEVTRQTIDVFDLDGTPQSAAFIDALAAQQAAVTVCPTQAAAEGACAPHDQAAALSREEALTRLQDAASDAYIEIPAGFGAALLENRDTHVSYVSQEAMGETSILQQVAVTAARRVQGIVSAERIAVDISDAVLDGDAGFVAAMRSAAADLWASSPISITVTEAAVKQPEMLVGLQQSVPGMGSMYVMFLILAGAGTLVQERRLWTLQRLAIAPVSNSDILLGKLLARFALGMMQYAVAFGTGLVLAQMWGVSFGNNPLALVAVMAAFSLCISTFTLLMATFVATPEQAGSLVTLVTLILAPIGGAWWSLDFEFIPDFMRTISVISPFKWVIDGFRNVIALDQGFGGVLVPVGVLLAASGVMFVLAVRRFRVV